jgi:hypothetical protein
LKNANPISSKVTIHSFKEKADMCRLSEIIPASRFAETSNSIKEVRMHSENSKKIYITCGKYYYIKQ